MKQSKFKETEIGKVPKEWNVKELQDCVDLIIDYRGKTPKKLGGNWSNKGYMALSAKNIKQGRIVDKDSIRFIDEVLYKNWMKDEIQRGDVLITSEGPLGECMLWDSDEKIVLSQRLFAIRINRAILDSAYFHCYASSKKFQHELSSRATGTTVLGIRQSELIKTKISIPPIKEQKAIAKILSDLDSKIELNIQMNDTLEAIGQALFKHWFVDFEFPNEKGKPYKSSGGEMVDSELREIPKGWEIGKISDLIKILSGFAFKSSQFVENGEYHLVTIKNVQDGYLDLSKTNFLNYLPEGMPNYCLLKSGDILLSLTGNVGRCCLVNDENLLLNQRVAKLQARNTRDSAYTYTLFRQQTMKRTLENAAKGTAQANLSPIETANMEIQVPPNELLETFSKRATPLLEKVLENKSKIRVLENLRNTLLPQLMSGAVRVRLQ